MLDGYLMLNSDYTWFLREWFVGKHSFKHARVHFIAHS